MGAADLLDRAIGAISPRWAFERKQYRQMSAITDGEDDSGSGYRAAWSGERLDAWIAQNASQDAHLGAGRREKLVARSREIERNSGIGRAIINAIVRNDVGRGIRPRPAIDAERLGINDEQASEYRDFLLEQWQCFVREAPSDERGTIYDQQALVDRRRFVDGDCLTRITSTDRPNRRFRTAVEVVECDRIRTPHRFSDRPGIRDGVVRGRGDQAVAFWVTREHPGDLGLAFLGGEFRFSRVPVWDNGIKVGSFSASRIRPGQTRGEPALAPVLTSLRHFDKYIEAELVAKRIESCLTGFIERQPQFGTPPSQSSGSTEIEWEPGVFKELPPGGKAHIVNPVRPGAQFEPYTYLMMRQIGAGIGMPLELFLLDWSKSNYSNTRAGILDAIRHFEMRQASLVDEHTRPAWVAWIEEMWLRGMLPPFVRDFYEKLDLWTAAIWVPHGRKWVDPQKDGKSVEIQLDRGLSNVQIGCDELGRDWKDVARGDIEARLWAEAEEARQREEKGMPAPAPPAPQQDQQADPSGNGEEEPGDGEAPGGDGAGESGDDDE